jgi:hypothetical protein
MCTSPGRFCALQFHAEIAERCASVGHLPPGPAEDAERGGEISPPEPKKTLGSWMRGTLLRCSVLDPEGSPPRELFSADSACSA